jgi:hypothetical protein
MLDIPTTVDAKWISFRRLIYRIEGFGNTSKFSSFWSTISFGRRRRRCRIMEWDGSSATASSSSSLLQKSQLSEFLVIKVLRS